LRVAQLRDLFTTEDSTEVSYEDEDRWLVLPERTQLDERAAEIGKPYARNISRGSHFTDCLILPFERPEHGTSQRPITTTPTRRRVHQATS